MNKRRREWVSEGERGRCVGEVVCVCVSVGGGVCSVVLLCLCLGGSTCTFCIVF